MSLLAGLYGWLPTKCIDAQGRPLALMSGVALREKFFGLNRRWSPEPTDAEVSARVAGILKGIGVRCRRKRRSDRRLATPADWRREIKRFALRMDKLANRPSPLLAMLKAPRKGKALIVRFE